MPLFSHLLCWWTKRVVPSGLFTVNALKEVVDGNYPANTRLPYAMANIIMYAIWGSPKGRLTRPEIEIALMRRFIYFSNSEHSSKTEVSQRFLQHSFSFKSTLPCVITVIAALI